MIQKLFGGRFCVVESMNFLIMLIGSINTVMLLFTSTQYKISVHIPVHTFLP